MDRDENRGGDEKVEEEQTSIAKHYGWFYSLYQLAETSILSITGDRAITDLNVIFAFNYLSLQLELNLEKEQLLKQSQWKT